MLEALKRKKDPAAKATPAKAASVDARPFIPQYTHYNSHTIVTKDGGVMQTIRVMENKSGLNYEPYERGGAGLRECIRRALVTHIASDNVSIWIHTLRKRRAVSFQAHYDNDFAAYVNKSWRAKNGWSHQYYNEVYITLVYDGQKAKLFDKELLKDGLTIKNNRSMRENYIEASGNELDLMMDSVADELRANYNVHRLTIDERMAPPEEGLDAGTMFYSEQMEFLGYLLNLREEQVPLPDADISAALQSCDLIFGFNALETKSDEGVKRFGAMLSLKEYREVPSHTVDMLLQAPMELVVTQAFHFIPADAALKEHREQKDYFDMSGDTYSMQASGLTEMLQANKGMPTDLGSQQTSIMVLVDELKKLDEDIVTLQKAFGALGLVVIREDIRLEELYWSMLPGNFIFLRRKSAIPTSRIGGFAKLNRFSSGHSGSTFWKEPVSLVPTLVNSPYFFNFHLQDNGHTLWIDFNSFNDNMAKRSLSFLVTQSHKLSPRVVYFDHHNGAELWFNKIGGEYRTLQNNTNNKRFALNPFTLEPTPRNIGFLTAWCGELVNADDEERGKLKSAVEGFYATGEQLNLDNFVMFLTLTDPSMARRFAPWIERGEYGGFFTAPGPDISMDHQWLGIDLSAAFSSPQNAVAAFAYLLHRVVLSLDGSPTIIVMQHALPVLSQPFFASRLASLLEMLKENNAMVIFCARYSESLPANPAMQTLIYSCATKVVVPDDLSLEYADLYPGLISPSEQDLLRGMERMQGDVMVKQGDETVALRIDLDIMPDVSAIFDNDIKTLMSAGGPFSAIPKKADS